ncbi:MAG: beta-ketoacyl-ACP synthase II [Thermodesulfobacteriota bacterium]
MSRRVVITGIGLITPIGVGTQQTWDAICRGDSGITRINKFDPSKLKTQIAGEVKGFDALDYVNPKEAKRNDDFINFSIATTKIALEDADLEIDDELSPMAGCVIASGIGGMESYYDTVLVLESKGPSRLSPFFIPNIVTNMAAGYASIVFNAKGPNCCTTTACAASGHALTLSQMLIQRGDADVMITGGTEAPIIPLTVGGFNAMRALSTRNDDPGTASRPFDKDRDGFIISEGAGTLILEELEHAKKRGARIYAELLGSGMSGDAGHITAPALDGPVRSMKSALRDAKINPEDIDYINAHGTSTQLNDINETNAIKDVFGENAYNIPISSTKSMTGHMLGAAGAVEASISSLAIHNGIIPPTINLLNPDPECDLDYVPNELRERKIKTVMSNTYGFGGTNSSVIVRKLS